MTSLPVETPGNKGRSILLHSSDKSTVNPGLTANFDPAFLA